MTGDFQLAKSYLGLEMAVSCELWVTSGEYLRAQERNFRAWVMWYLKVNLGWVR